MNLAEILDPIAQVFKNLGVPQPIVHWGHPFFMSIVIFTMGSFVGLAGWRGRLVTDTSAAMKSRDDHRKLAPLMTAFLAAGYTGRSAISGHAGQAFTRESPLFNWLCCLNFIIYQCRNFSIRFCR